MELKETKHLSTSAELNVVTPPEKNNSQSQGIYNVLFLFGRLKTLDLKDVFR